MIKIIGDFTTDEEKEVLRNLEVLYSTREGELALDRDFGLAQNFHDMPGPAAESLFIQEIILKTTTYEPRAEVVSIDFGPANPGELNPEVTINVGD